MRLSLNVKKNMLKEDNQSYTPLAKNDLDVKLNNRDQEIDLGEGRDDEEEEYEENDKDEEQDPL